MDGDEHGRTQCHFGGIPKPQGIGNDVFEETGNDVFEGTGNDLCEAWELKAGVVTVDGLFEARAGLCLEWLADLGRFGRR